MYLQLIVEPVSIQGIKQASLGLNVPTKHKPKREFQDRMNNVAPRADLEVMISLNDPD